MKEIKFRAWDSAGNRMITPYCYLNDGNFWGEDCTNTGISVAHEDVMQYTGLKDKNGTEIYDGDILKFKDHGDVSHHVIKWDNEGFRWTDTRLEDGDSATAYYGFDFFSEAVVIGNIYQNPYLLNRITERTSE